MQFFDSSGAANDQTPLNNPTPFSPPEVAILEAELQKVRICSFLNFFYPKFFVKNEICMFLKLFF